MPIRFCWWWLNIKFVGFCHHLKTKCSLVCHWLACTRWGSMQATPKWTSLAWGLFPAKDNQVTTDSRRASYLTLNCLIESRYGACARRRAFFHQKWHKNICWPDICSAHLPRNHLSPLLSPRPHPILLGSGQCMSQSPDYLRASHVSMSLWGSCTYEIKFAFLLLICLMSI